MSKKFNRLVTCLIYRYSSLLRLAAVRLWMWQTIQTPDALVSTPKIRMWQGATVRVPTLPRQIQTKRQTQKTHDFETQTLLRIVLQLCLVLYNYSEHKLEKHYIVIIFVFVWLWFYKIFVLPDGFCSLNPIGFYIS